MTTRKPARRATSAVLIILVLITIIWDIYVVYFNDEKGDSISRIIHDLGNRFWFIQIFVGVLIGHFFWPLGDQEEK